MAQQKARTKGRKITSVVIWILAILIILGGLAIAGLQFFLSNSKPVIEGETTVSILDADVSVTRDEVGVPHISAKSDADLYRAQGYVQAQDRLFQMDLARRQASGMLAEVVGAAAVDTDKYFRTFSLRQAAELSWQDYDADSQQILQWFADGVNAFIDEVKGTSKLSYEFKLLGYKPEPWTPIDSLVIGKYMAYDLGGNWNQQAFRSWALQNYSKEQAEELFVDYPENAKSIIEANLNLSTNIASTFTADYLPPEFNGSNNWVIGGELTKSGKPLLADDPHLGLSSPSVWYQMHLQSPEQNVSGVIFAGIPGIILGHNDEIAWGVTNVNPDVQDLYIEIPNPENPHQFKYDGNWEDATVRQETIQVKDEEPIDFEVIETRHGPIISNIITKDTEVKEQFAMQWTALQSTQELKAVLGFNKSKNWEEFDKALKDFKAPAQNFVFASKDGTIAYKANGLVPIRKQGTGALPVPGDSSAYGWESYIPFDELPTVMNPKEGYIATANNEVVGDEYPYHLSNLWAQPYRYERIVEMIETADSKLTIDDMKAMQMDQKNLHAVEFLPNLLQTIKAQDTNGEYKDVIALLESWNYVDAKDQGAPLVYHFLIETIENDLFKEAMPEDIYKLMAGKSLITDQLLRDAYAGKPGVWITNAGGLDQLVYTAFEKSIDKIEDSFGENVSKWQWGSYNQLLFKHPLASASELLATFLNPKQLPVGGSSVTVQAAAEDGNGNVTHGASWRFVVDVDNLSAAQHIVGPGLSGHIKSKWYDNQVQDWIDGDYHITYTDGSLNKQYKLKLKAQ
ncbi:penicillin acylase family protein [Lysinibacillus sp. 2017]|uniref:penicillin acylase family protein n=1 Tax=unclassified Lysinibacillus TaxID=2636778 RepID=UPI000D5291E2|nr:MULTISPECIES: penicillin acylase family protein [unclassified Lysinibacillus]AWE08943.1 penicillin acylase family protein [Lysinibacillus sp. 2017]TGN35547.1 penicillin acylase family protein [Lysinibacillus sp. S2017]